MRARTLLGSLLLLVGRGCADRGGVCVGGSCADGGGDHADGSEGEIETCDTVEPNAVEAPWVTTHEWRTEVVDPAAGYASDMAIDDSDVVHISYLGLNELRYATNANGSWTIEPFIGPANHGRGYQHLALGPDGSVHVIFLGKNESPGVRHATNVDGEWQNELIVDQDEGDTLSSETDACGAIAVDLDGTVSVAYPAAVTPHPRESIAIDVASNASGSWVAETVEEEGSIRAGQSLAMDASGDVHLVWGHEEVRADGSIARWLRYAELLDGTWREQVVDGIQDGARIALAPGGAVHLVYDMDYGLRHATNERCAWEVDMLEPPERGRRASIAVGADGAVHLGYAGGERGEQLTYMTNVSGTWTKELVATADDFFDAVSIALDSDDDPHFSFYENADEALHFAEPVE